MSNFILYVQSYLRTPSVYCINLNAIDSLWQKCSKNRKVIFLAGTVKIQRIRSGNHRESLYIIFEHLKLYLSNSYQLIPLSFSQENLQFSYKTFSWISLSIWDIRLGRLRCSILYIYIIWCEELGSKICYRYLIVDTLCIYNMCVRAYIYMISGNFWQSVHMQIE